MGMRTDRGAAFSLLRVVIRPRPAGRRPQLGTPVSLHQCIGGLDLGLARHSYRPAEATRRRPRGSRPIAWLRRCETSSKPAGGQSQGPDADSSSRPRIHMTCTDSTAYDSGKQPMAQWPLAEAAFGAHLMEPRVSGHTFVSSRLGLVWYGLVWSGRAPVHYAARVWQLR